MEKFIKNVDPEDFMLDNSDDSGENDQLIHKYTEYSRYNNDEFEVRTSDIY